MNKFSEWNKVDLHIHSKKSSLVKENDYNGNEYDARTLLDVLMKADNSVNIFSITDHNCINTNLYKKLNEEIQNEIYKNKINYIVGVELDVLDEKIYEDVFHCLCFFDSRDVDLIEKSVNQLFNDVDYSERNNKNNFPCISKIFDVFSKNKIYDILLIPHFNNKSKGLPQNIAIENLNYLCFNAYEDSNNINNIQKSLNIYLKNGFNNFPFAVFSDNHNLNVYPLDKMGNRNNIDCYILGNIAHPFNSVKTAFQEARMRISLTNIDHMRNIFCPEKYLSKIFINGIPYKLSPYQNTIIGKFGSGKSLLLEKIKHGNDSLETSEKYSEFYGLDKEFKVSFENESYNSLDELRNTINNYKIYEFVQQEKYYYKNYFTLEEAKQLFKQLNMSHEFKSQKTYYFDTEQLKKYFKNINEKILKTDGKNNLNYGRAFDNQDYYSFGIVFENMNFDQTIKKLDENNANLEDLIKLSINDIPIFNKFEKQKIKELNDIINLKRIRLNKLYEIDYEKDIQKILRDYNNEYINNNSKDIKDTLVKEIQEFNDDLISFANECEKFENVFTQELYNDEISNKEEKIKENYKICWKHNCNKEYKDCISSIIKDANRETNLFKSTLKTLIGNEKKFFNNRNFEELIDKYNNYANGLFTSENIQYDILFKNESMLKKSAGEKSSLFIKFIFDLLEEDLISGENVLLILDQPEDNIDNDNVYNEISSRLKELKVKYNNFQSLIVTHNANVAISADSENIIIANEKIKDSGNKDFIYDFGCIEDKEFIEKVCNILEGGKKAMERRTIKYGINIIRKVEENEI